LQRFTTVEGCEGKACGWLYDGWRAAYAAGGANYRTLVSYCSARASLDVAILKAPSKFWFSGLPLPNSLLVEQQAYNSSHFSALMMTGRQLMTTFTTPYNDK
jgi:hypothetical protein